MTYMGRRGLSGMGKPAAEGTWACIRFVLCPRSCEGNRGPAHLDVFQDGMWLSDSQKTPRSLQWDLKTKNWKLKETPGKLEGLF